jgi:hypothetical protein
MFPTRESHYSRFHTEMKYFYFDPCSTEIYQLHKEGNVSDHGGKYFTFLRSETANNQITADSEWGFPVPTHKILNMNGTQGRI